MARNRITVGHTALVAVALFFPLLARAAAPQAQEQARQPDNRPAGEVYKNLEIFSRMPASRLDRVMEMFNKVLGAECTHCHVQDQWAREDVEAKQTARKMLRMVGSISREFFEGKGGPTCWTCHRGSNKPEMNPPK